jgi:hypothetical protein
MCQNALQAFSVEAHAQIAHANYQGTVRVHGMRLVRLMAHSLSKQQHVLLQPPVR